MAMLQEVDKNKEHRIRQYFLVSIFFKGVISFAEIVLGIATFFIPLSLVTDTILRYTDEELAENSTDFIANQLNHIVHHLSFASGTFIALYLLSRGLLKALLIVGLLKNQLWAYPASLIVIALFILYQIYQLVILFSLPLIALTVFDLFVMWSIWREYEVVLLQRKKYQAP